MGQPLIFPHGVTVYNPEKCWNGYTIVPLINDRGAFVRHERQ